MSDNHFHEQAKGVAADVYGEAVDGRDMRNARITAKLLEMVDHLQRDVVDHMKTEGVIIEDLKHGLVRVEKRVEDFVAAFPEGNGARHRIEHESQRLAAKEVKELWSKLKFTLIALTLTSVTAWVFVAVWKAFLLGPIK